MRIISGSLKGRSFEAVSGNRTHPMSEKARGAIFNALGDISGLTMLDPYAGTGALAFEAISRGVTSAQCIEADPRAYKTIRLNTTKLSLEGVVMATRAYAHAWSRRHQSKKYDLVLLDPPYDNVEPKDLILLANHAKNGGIIVISLPTGNGFRLGSSKQEILSTKNYGDAELAFYRQLV